MPLFWSAFAVGCGSSVVLLAWGNTSSKPSNLREKITQSVALLQHGAKTFRERSEGGCIACHHQGPLQTTIALARQKGIPINEEWEREEINRIYGFYARRKELYRRAIHDYEAHARADSYGNFNIHIGYWLLGYAEEGGKADEATAAATLLLASKQKEDGHWDFEDTARAPLQASDFITTAQAVRVLQLFMPVDQQESMKRRVDLARKWLQMVSPRTTDDLVYKLYGLVWTGSSPDVIQPLVKQLLQAQREDHGWAQQANMPSDAYATGLVLLALHRAGDIPVTSPAYQRGIEYLLRTQQADGSWFVRSRSIPTNPYFESGFPHGRSQFISFAATCLATDALLLTLESIP